MQEKKKRLKFKQPVFYEAHIMQQNRAGRGSGWGLIETNVPLPNGITVDHPIIPI